MSAPLQDILVVALEQAVAAPFCSSRLADAGARVIKVERPEGDFARAYDDMANGKSAYFCWINRGKESLTLNIKDRDDAELLHRILAKADVFIQNLAPDAAARAGFGSEMLRGKYPRLITCDISGYGEQGEYSKMKAYDLLVQCESGLAAVTGSADQPGRVGVSICDIACGLYAYSAVLKALLQRQQTGKGTGIKLSLFDCIADWMTPSLFYWEARHQEPPRTGLSHHAIAPYGAHRTSDGHQIVIAVQNNREWQNFCETVLGNPALAQDSRFINNVNRCENRSALDAEIDQVFNVTSRSELIARLQQGNIAYGALNSVADFAAHPQLRRQPVDTPGGEINLIAPPVVEVGEPVSFAPVPELGQHDQAIRAEFSNRSDAHG